MDAGAHRLVEVGQETVGPGDAGEQGEVGFRDREGQVRLARVAPGGDDLAAAGDEAVRRAAGEDRAEDGVVRRGLEMPGLDMGAQVAGEGAFVGGGEGRGLGKAGGVHERQTATLAAPA